MFTGLISDCGRVGRVTPLGDNAGRRMVIETTWDTASLETGASIACSGVCLTAVDRGDGWFAVDVSRETLSCSTLAAWEAGTPVNLERSLTAGDELGGHFVSGHVDAVAEVTGHVRDGESWRTTIAVPPRLMGMIAPKGSVAVDGVSLTVNEVGADSFGVNIIPHTAAVTTFGEMKSGDRVNLEIDMLARYVVRVVEAQWTTRRI